MRPITSFFNPADIDDYNTIRNSNQTDDITSEISILENDDSIHEDEQIKSTRINIIKKEPKKDKFSEGKYERNHCFCQNIVEISGKQYVCKYHCRIGRYMADHDCTQYIEREKTKIDAFVTNQPLMKYLKTEDLTLEDHVALVCGELNLSIRCVCSDEFHDLLYHFIREGQKSTKFGSTPYPRKIYHAKDRNKMRQRIINLSQNIFLRQCQIASIPKIIAVAIDGGTVAHNHFVDVLLSDIIHDTGSFLFESYTYKVFNSKAYLEIGKDIINKAQSQNIRLSCIVGDRLRAQVKGLDHLHPNSLQNTFHDKPEYSSILFIPCICHIINRSLVKSIKKNSKLTTAVNMLNSLQVLLRKPVIYSIIKRFIPALIETRWIYVFDAAFWAVQNKELINAVFVKSSNETVKKYLKNKRFSQFSNGIPLIIEEICLIMLPIKAFLNQMENEKAPLWWIKPLFEQLTDHLIKLESSLKELSSECKLIRSEITSDFNSFARVELIKTAYSFTSLGRNYFRKNFFGETLEDNEIDYPENPQLDFSKYLTKLNDSEFHFIFEKLVHDISSTTTSSSDDDDMQDKNTGNKTEDGSLKYFFSEDSSSEEEENKYEDEEDFEKDHNRNREDNLFNNNKTKSKQKSLFDYYLETIDDVDDKNSKQINDPTNLFHWRQLENMKKEGDYQLVLYCVKEICKCKKFDKEKRRNVVNQFQNFFQYSCEMLPNGDLLYDSNIEFWVSAIMSQSMHDIAEIALIFLSLPASQTICERNISIKRSSVSKQQYKMKNDILNARAKLSCSKKRIELKLNT